MKTFMVLLGGILAAILVAVGVLFYLFGQDSAVSTQEGTSPTAANENMFTVSGTLIVPPALASTVKNGAGFVQIAAFGINPGTEQAFNSNASEIKIFPNPIFPLKFSVQVNREAFLAQKDQKYVTVTAHYYQSPVPPISNPLDSKQRITLASQRISVPIDSSGEAKIPPQIEAGSVSFFRVYHERPSPSCASAKNLVSGKFTPAAGSKKDWRKLKIAFSVWEENQENASFFQEKISREQLNKNFLHYQFLDFSSGSAAFSIPKKGNPEANLLFSLVECRPGEDLAGCALRGFPYIPNLNENQAPIYLADKHFRMPYCGMNDFDGTIAETSTLAIGLPRDPYATN
ncbi:MAG: hypothetical protein AB7K68_16220 [Bacteriovoracia bacterium]